MIVSDVPFLTTLKGRTISLSVFVIDHPDTPTCQGQLHLIQNFMHRWVLIQLLYLLKFTQIARTMQSTLTFHSIILADLGTFMN